MTSLYLNKTPTRGQSILLSKELEAGLRVCRAGAHHTASIARGEKSPFSASNEMEKAATEARAKQKEQNQRSIYALSSSRKTGRHMLNLVPIWFLHAVSHFWGNGPMARGRVLTPCCSWHSHAWGAVEHPAEAHDGSCTDCSKTARKK